MLVGEGIEISRERDAGFRACPAWRVLGIGGLANVEFASDVVEIIVLGENDERLRKAIDKAAPSLAEKGIKVRVAQPPPASAISTTSSIRAKRVEGQAALSSPR